MTEVRTQIVSQMVFVRAGRKGEPQSKLISTGILMVGRLKWRGGEMVRGCWTSWGELV